MFGVVARWLLMAGVDGTGGEVLMGQVAKWLELGLPVDQSRIETAFGLLTELPQRYGGQAIGHRPAAADRAATDTRA